MPVFAASATKIFGVEMHNTHLAPADAPPPGAGKNLSRHRATSVAVFNRSAAGTAPVRIRASNLSVPNARQRGARLRRDRDRKAPSLCYGTTERNRHKEDRGFFEWGTDPRSRNQLQMIAKPNKRASMVAPLSPIGVRRAEARRIRARSSRTRKSLPMRMTHWPSVFKWRRHSVANSVLLVTAVMVLDPASERIWTKAQVADLLGNKPRSLCAESLAEQ